MTWQRYVHALGLREIGRASFQYSLLRAGQGFVHLHLPTHL
jgi:hypothetical protein